MQEEEKQKSPRAPDWEKYITDKNRHEFVTYAKWFGDTVGGVREVKLFNIFDRKHEEFDQNQKDIIEKQKQMNMPGQWNTITDSLVPFSARGIDDMCQMFILKTNFQVR